MKVKSTQSKKIKKANEYAEDFNVSRRNFRKKMHCLSVASLRFLGNEPLEI